MLFENCEICSEIGTRACRCDNSLQFFCDSHAKTHILSSKRHSIESALEALSVSQISLLREAYNNHRHSSLCQLIDMKNSRVEHLLQEIRRVEEEYSHILEHILSGSIARDVQQILSYKAIPVFSDSSLAQSLLNLKHGLEFSSPKILDLLNTLNFPFLSSLSPSFSSPTYTFQAPPSSIASVQISPVLHSSSQNSLMQTADRTDYRWELLKKRKANNGWIYSIAVSDCEKYVASAGDDKTIKIWELKTLDLLRTLTGHTEDVISVAFITNNVVSGSSDKTIKIWEEDRCISTLLLHSGWVNSVCVSSCKKLMISGSSDKTVVVHRLEDNKTLYTLRHSDSVRSAVFSRNDKEIVSGVGKNNGYGKINIWKTETGELLKILDAHADVVMSVSYSEKFILSSSKDKTVKVWGGDKSEPLLTFDDHTGSICTADSKDNIVASLGYDDQIIVRDIRNGKIIQVLQGHGTYPGGGGKMGLKILEEGLFIVSGGRNKNLKVWRRVN